MTYKLILDSKGWTSYDGIFHEPKQEEYEFPFEFFETVWYCYKKRKKYVVLKTRISGIWATNCTGVTLDNGWHIDYDSFDRIFKDKNQAIDWCIEQNQRIKVKVYGE